MFTAGKSTTRLLLCCKVPSWIQVPSGIILRYCGAQERKQEATRRVRSCVRNHSQSWRRFPSRPKYDDPGIRSACKRKFRGLSRGEDKGTKALVGREDPRGGAERSVIRLDISQATTYRKREMTSTGLSLSPFPPVFLPFFLFVSLSRPLTRLRVPSASTSNTSGQCREQL